MKKVTFIILIVIVVGAISFYFLNSSKINTKEIQNTSVTQSSIPGAPKPLTIEEQQKLADSLASSSLKQSAPPALSPSEQKKLNDQLSSQSAPRALTPAEQQKLMDSLSAPK